VTLEVIWLDFIEFEESNSYSQCLWVDLALRVLILAEPMFIQRINNLLSLSFTYFFRYLLLPFRINFVLLLC